MAVTNLFGAAVAGTGRQLERRGVELNEQKFEQQQIDQRFTNNLNLLNSLVNAGAFDAAEGVIRDIAQDSDGALGEGIILDDDQKKTLNKLGQDFLKSGDSPNTRRNFGTALSHFGRSVSKGRDIEFGKEREARKEEEQGAIKQQNIQQQAELIADAVRQKTGKEPSEGAIQSITFRLQQGEGTQDIFESFVGENKEGTTPAKIQIFETVTGIKPEIRGTPEYKEAFLNFRKETEGRQQIVGTTPEGQLIKFNTIDGTITTVDVPTILPKTKKIVSGEVAGQIAVMDSLIAQIGDVRKISLDNPEFTGPVEGRWNKLKSVFVDNKDFTLLDRNVESLITLAYALSGKQISEQEMRMLKAAILPAVTQPDANFQVALDFAQNWLTANRDNRLERLKSFGFFTGAERGKTPITPAEKGIQGEAPTTADSFLQKYGGQ